MCISNKKLILLAALAYYEEFSDQKVVDITKKTITIEDVIDYIVKEKSTTCFDGVLGYSDTELGMDKIVSLIQSDKELLNLEIVYPKGKNDKTTSSVCLVNAQNREVYVVYVGDYAESPYNYIDKDKNIIDIDSWLNNGQGATLSDTEEQKRDLDFYMEAINAARERIRDYECDLEITVCGHSTGGNHAQYVTIAYGTSNEYKEINDIDNCVSFDG